jgi:glycerol uptake facilitator-like aquaporin
VIDKIVKRRAYFAEAIGSFFLFATVVGSGIMAERLAEGNIAVALLGNTIATGAMLFVLITMLGPISGAHFNPAVSLVMAIRRSISAQDACVYALIQIGCGVLGVWAAHLMFDISIFQFSGKIRTGLGQWTGEAIATLGLILTIIETERQKPKLIAASVSLYIVAAYWFTSSTSFANPAITIARSLSETFSGIAPANVPMFIVAQICGAFCALLITKLLAKETTNANGDPQ